MKSEFERNPFGNACAYAKNKIEVPTFAIQHSSKVPDVA